MNKLYEAVENYFSNGSVINDVEKTLRKELLIAKARYHRVQDYPETASYYMNHNFADLSKIDNKHDVSAFRLVFENGEEVYLNKNIVDDWSFDVNESEDTEGNIYSDGGKIIRKTLSFKTGFLKLKLPILKHLYTIDGIDTGKIEPDAIERITSKCDITHILLKLSEEFSNGNPSELLLIPPYIANTDCDPIKLTIPPVFENHSQTTTHDQDYLIIQWVIFK